MKIMLPVTLLATALICIQGRAAEPTEQEVDWIRKNAFTFKTVEAGSGFDDLAPLKELIGDAQIVSLGESTHGSREIFQMKHRLVEFLASEMDFSFFAIEASMPESYRVNGYVLEGKGELTFNGEKSIVGPGTAILTRPGDSHGLKPAGEEQLVIIIVYEIKDG